jgi:glucokinase
MSMKLLAGDIGGTKINLAIFDSDGGNLSVVAEDTLLSQGNSSFESLVLDFLAKKGESVTAATFGVAGPVNHGRVKLTNLSWVLDEKELERSLDIPFVVLMNDLEATSYSIPFLNREDLEVLNEGEPAEDAHGTVAVIAPGTGLGEGFLTWDGNRYTPNPSEGGHCDFAPTSASQIELLRYLAKKFGHVSYERVCSGPGLTQIYIFFHEDKSDQSHAEISREISQAEDPTPIIVKFALQNKGSCNPCSNTLDTFVSIFGAEASNLALKVLPRNGLYLAGGVPLHLRSALKDEHGFMRSYLAKGRMSEVVSAIPVKLVLTPRAALLGAAHYGFDLASSKAMLVAPERNSK